MRPDTELLPKTLGVLTGQVFQHRMVIPVRRE